MEELEEITVVDYIRHLCEERSWSYYRLAKESGIAYSTLNTMFRKTKAPAIHTLERICSAFGMSLSTFFSQMEGYQDMPACETYHLSRWNSLTPENRDAAEKYLDYLLAQQK